MTSNIWSKTPDATEYELLPVYDDDDALSDIGVQATSWQGNRGVVAWFCSRPRNVRRLICKISGSTIGYLFKYVLFMVLALLIGTPIFGPSYTHYPDNYLQLESRCLNSTGSGCANAFNERVFITVSLYDAGGHLASGKWGESLLELIDLIGNDNVYLSIYENDSGPEGEKALNSLKSKLKCQYSLVYDRNTTIHDFPTITMPDGTKRLKRIAYLAELRNRALRPLDTLSEDGVRFDRILFLNDIAFHPMEAAHLLFSTNVGLDGRAHYLSVCGLDYSTPFRFYDIFAMRDAEGYAMGFPVFPIFSKAGQGLSRDAMLAGSDAVPVTGCWGGIVAMQAKHVQNLDRALPDPSFQKLGRHDIDPAHPRNVTSPVRFRHEPELYYDACECCLFLADVAQIARKQEEEEQGVYVNPYVRVAYDHKILWWLRWTRLWERLLVIPQSIFTPLARHPHNNPYRAVQEGETFMEEVWVNIGDGGFWEMVERKGRSGMFCGERFMLTIRPGDRKEGKNWEKFKAPKGYTLGFPR
ncbi:hypothetical protein PT974_00444 [Cladobotryum mycophilum]|uniref:Glycosyltransferase family 69 protein n=1 Tax=Cladobotryum mycophilum TaxID=491253 RepID=A0ABR0T1N4_9HYPO